VLNVGLFGLHFGRRRTRKKLSRKGRNEIGLKDNWDVTVPMFNCEAKEARDRGAESAVGVLWRGGEEDGRGKRKCRTPHKPADRQTSHS